MAEPGYNRTSRDISINTESVSFRVEMARPKEVKDIDEDYNYGQQSGQQNRSPYPNFQHLNTSHSSP